MDGFSSGKTGRGQYPFKMKVGLRRSRGADAPSFVREPDMGAFFIFLNVERALSKKYNSNDGEKLVNTSDELAFYILNQKQVVTVPGSGFGSDKHLRISFASSEDEIKKGAQAIVELLG